MILSVEELSIIKHIRNSHEPRQEIDRLKAICDSLTAGTTPCQIPLTCDTQEQR